MLRIITGRAGAGKTALIIDEIRAAAARGEGGRCMIVPEQYSHEAERELCAAVGDSMPLYAAALSFTSLARRVEAETGGSREALDAGGRLLCMALALDAVGAHLRVYGSSYRRAETQLALLSAVGELKTAVVDSEALESAASVGGTLGAKLSDLALVLAAYDAAVGAGRADPSDALTRLCESLPRSEFGAAGHIYIDGFTDFTAQQTAVLRALLAKGADMTVCLTCEGLSEGSEVFELSRRTANMLLREAKEAGVDCTVTELDPEGDANAADFLSERLFTYSQDRWTLGADAVRLYSAGSVTAECELAAARARELARGGCRWRDIAVAVRGFEEYRGALTAAFEYYGVPLFTTRKADILRKPLSALIAAAYDTIEGGWESDDVFAYLRTGLAGLSAEECDILENYCIIWGARASMWLSEKDWRPNPDGPDGEWNDSARERLVRINALRRRAAAPLLALAEACKTAQTALEQAQALAGLFEALSLADRLAERSAQLESDGRAQTAAENTRLWELTVTALEQTALILGDTPMDAERFRRLFLLTLSQYSVGIIPVSLDMVTAGDFDRMRRRSIKHLIVLGASDERLPSGAREGGVFSPEERRELSELGIELGGGEAELWRELTLIYNCISLPSETLTLVTPAWAENGAPARPSFVMSRAAKLFGRDVVPADRRAVKSAAPAPALELAAQSVRAPGDALARECAKYFDARGNEMERVRLAAALTRGSLSARSVSALYGERPGMSATRTDKFASCRFAFFLRYGLKAKPRRAAEFSPPEYGTFMHYVLEHVASETSASGGFAQLSDDELTALTDKYVAQYVDEELDGLEDATPRFKYLFNRLISGVRRVVADMADELRAGSFEPLFFELDLRRVGALSGIADRVDGWLKDGTLYLRVVDYKTGRKSFSLSDVMHGLNLQMLLYLFTLTDAGEELCGHPVAPAGVLYIPAWDKIISAPADLSDAEISAKRASGHRRSGLLLDDPDVLRAMEESDTPVRLPVKWKDGAPSGDSLASAERLGLLERRIHDTLTAMTKELRAGSITADPFYRGAQDNACLYCDYADACRFSDGEDGDTRRYIQKLPATKIWNMLEGGGENG